MSDHGPGAKLAPARAGRAHIGSDLPKEWKTSALGSVADIAFSGVDKKTVTGESPIRLCNYVDVFHNTVIDHRLPFMLATATKAEIARFQLRRGDVVFTKDSETPEEIAVPAYVAEDLPDVVCGYHLGIARAREEIDGRFLFFAMQSREVRAQFARLANGVTRFGLTQDSLMGVRLPIPPLSEQSHIAELLAAWDEAIRWGSHLEMLVEKQYRGVRARGIRSRGNKMRPLSDLISADKMKIGTPTGKFRALGVRSHGKGTFQRVDDLDALGSGKTVYRVEPNRFVVNIVFAWEGAAAITTEDDAGCLVSHRFPTFTINEKVVNREYFRHMIRTPGFQHLLALASPGGAGRNKTLNRNDFLRFEVHVPPLEEQRRVATALTALDRRLQLVRRYLECLTSERDGLSAELLSGRLRVERAPASRTHKQKRGAR